MSENIDSIALVGYGNECYHKPIWAKVEGVDLLHTRCGFSSLDHDMELVSPDDLPLVAPDAKPCKKCFNEKYCQLCGERTTLLRRILVGGRVRRACEVCWSEEAR